MIKLEDINYQNVEESFGMGGPLMGDVYLQENKLKGRFLVDNDKYSDDKQYLLLSRWRGEIEIHTKILGFIPMVRLGKDFRIVIIERATNKIYQSQTIESALYIVNMLNGLITYYQAFHDGIKKFERSMNFSEETFKEITDNEIYE